MVNFPSRPNSRPVTSPRPCGVRRHDAALELGDMSPSGSHGHNRNQTKNPCNRASSSLIKANAQISKRPGRARHSMRAVTANPNATVGNHLHDKSGNRRWQAAAGTGLPALPCLALFARFAVPPKPPIQVVDSDLKNPDCGDRSPIKIDASRTGITSTSRRQTEINHETAN